MEYVINQSGNRVVLDLLANATKSLVETVRKSL